jgi:DeoR/GlpR family transcriptional regulator of sugar metabolism
VDAFFLSTKAFIPGEGTYESSMATLRIKQLVARRAHRVVLLVDGGKFGQRAMCRVLDTAAIGLVITDERCPAAARRALRRAGCDVVIAALLRPVRQALAQRE